MPLRGKFELRRVGSFDYVSASLCESATSLRMTSLMGGEHFDTAN